MPRSDSTDLRTLTYADLAVWGGYASVSRPLSEEGVGICLALRTLVGHRSTTFVSEAHFASSPSCTSMLLAAGFVSRRRW